MTEHEKAKAWRLRNDWSMDDLADLTGYSKSAIMWFERGQGVPAKAGDKPRELNPYSWQRYRRVCHSVAVEQKSGQRFGW